ARTADRDAVERIQPAERPALGARSDERHDREPSAGMKRVGRAAQSEREVVHRAVAPDGKRGVDRLADGVELDRVAAHELDVVPAVAPHALTRLREHAVRAVEADDPAPLADRVHEQGEITARAAADVDDGLAFQVAEQPDDALPEPL